jgi:hypothetical protein
VTAARGSTPGRLRNGASLYPCTPASSVSSAPGRLSAMAYTANGA